MLRKLLYRSLWPISPCARFEGDEDGGGDGGGGDDPPVALADAEGNLRENWRDSLPEDIRNDPSLLEVTTVPGAMKMLVHAQKMTGRDRVAIPGENASDEDWSEFYNRVGRPRTVDDYQYERPEGIPDVHRSDTVMAEIRADAHANNLTQKQFTRMMAADDARILDEIAVRDSEAEGEVDAAEKYLKDLWGMGYEERIHIVNRLINETTEEGEERDRVIKELGRNVVFVEWAAGIGKTLVEHDALIAELTQKAPKEAQAELDEFMATDEYKKYLNGDYARDNKSKHEYIRKKVSDLYDIIHPEAGSR